jgi:hypothetical protein
MRLPLQLDLLQPIRWWRKTATTTSHTWSWRSWVLCYCAERHREATAHQCAKDRGPSKTGEDHELRSGTLEDTMTTEQNIICAKVGLLELAKQLGNVSQACKMMGYRRSRTPS